MRLPAIPAALLLGASLAGQAAEQQHWPDRPVRVVVPYNPGGGVDAFTRPIAARLSE